MENLNENEVRKILNSYKGGKITFKQAYETLNSEAKKLELEQKSNPDEVNSHMSKDDENISRGGFMNSHFDDLEEKSSRRSTKKEKDDENIFRGGFMQSHFDDPE